MTTPKENHELHNIDATDNSINIDDGKEVQVANIEHSDPQEKGPAQQMRTKADDLPIWESLKQYKLVSMLAMAAAFSASLDGYRESSPGQES